MPCSSCGMQLAAEDNYCRRCGVPLNVIAVPAVASEARAMTVWEEAKPAVARGIVLVAAGALLRAAIGWAGKAAFSRARSNGQEGLDARRIIPFAGGRPGGKGGSEEIEILWYRRVRR